MKSFVFATLAIMVNGEVLLQARGAQITARAVFDFGDMNIMKRQASDSQCPNASYTPCADGTGCCPGGAACFQSNGVGLCSVTCGANQPQCNFNGVSACCGMDEVCGGSMCVLASTAAPSTTPSSPTVTPTSNAPSSPTSTPSPSPTSTTTPTSSVVLNTSSLTTFPIPTKSFSFPSSSSATSSSCSSPSTYCSWPGTVLSGSMSAVSYSAMEGCCAGGCNTKTPGICLPTTVTSTSVVVASGSATKTTTGAVATVTHAGANRLVGSAWFVAIGAVLFGL